MLVHRRSFPPQFVRFRQQFAGIRLYPWVERGTVRVKCLAQEHNTVSPARARIRTARSGDERTNHESAAPPYYFMAYRKLFPCRIQWAIPNGEDSPLTALICPLASKAQSRIRFIFSICRCSRILTFLTLMINHAFISFSAVQIYGIHTYFHSSLTIYGYITN